MRVLSITHTFEFVLCAYRAVHKWNRKQWAVWMLCAMQIAVATKVKNFLNFCFFDKLIDMKSLTPTCIRFQVKVRKTQWHKFFLRDTDEVGTIQQCRMLIGMIRGSEQAIPSRERLTTILKIKTKTSFKKMFMTRVNYWASLISTKRECSNFSEKTNIAFRGLYEPHGQRISKKSVNNFGLPFKFWLRLLHGFVDTTKPSLGKV